jgi:hypothetical protein
MKLDEHTDQCPLKLERLRSADLSNFRPWRRRSPAARFRRTTFSPPTPEPSSLAQSGVASLKDSKSEASF